MTEVFYFRVRRKGREEVLAVQEASLLLLGA